MFLMNLYAEIVACILSLRKSRHKRRHKPNLESTSKYGFSPDLGGKNGDVLSMRMQVILDSSFARLGSAPTWGGKKGEFRNWTNWPPYRICRVFPKAVIGKSFLVLSQLSFWTVLFRHTLKREALRDDSN